MIETAKDFARRARRRLFERLGSARYSKPALFDLDDKLAPFLHVRGGVFVEAGANDGFQQSNTYFLESMLGWSGVLIEPIPQLARRCRVNRPRARVFQCALVSSDYSDATIEMTYSGLMTVARGAFGDESRAAAHVRRGARIQPGVEPYTISVPARTLTDVLRSAGVSHVDFMSLDLEGYEPQALRGLDLDAVAPRYLLVEVRDRDTIDEVLGERYVEVAKPTHHDVLFYRT